MRLLNTMCTLIDVYLYQSLHPVTRGRAHSALHKTAVPFRPLMSKTAKLFYEITLRGLLCSYHRSSKINYV